MMYGYLTLAMLSVFISFKENNRYREAMTASLPVRRSDIVKARYLTSAVILSCGLLLWYLNGLVGSMLYTDAATDYGQITQMKVVFMSLLFILIEASIFLPASFKYGFMGSILTFITALATAVASVTMIFRPYSHSYNQYFEIGDCAEISVLSVVMIAAPAISYMLSLKIYNSKNV
jgi:hypothetical protein